jgi:hypothetical protein
MFSVLWTSREIKVQRKQSCVTSTQLHKVTGMSAHVCGLWREVPPRRCKGHIWGGWVRIYLRMSAYHPHPLSYFMQVRRTLTSTIVWFPHHENRGCNPLYALERWRNLWWPIVQHHSLRTTWCFSWDSISLSGFEPRIVYSQYAVSCNWRSVVKAN